MRSILYRHFGIPRKVFFPSLLGMEMMICAVDFVAVFSGP